MGTGGAARRDEAWRGRWRGGATEAAKGGEWTDGRRRIGEEGGQRGWTGARGVAEVAALGGGAGEGEGEGGQQRIGFGD